MIQCRVQEISVPRLRECCRQVEAQKVSNSRNKIHQTWERPYRNFLYSKSHFHRVQPQPYQVASNEGFPRTMTLEGVDSIEEMTRDYSRYNLLFFSDID